jgi:hypothetical protein
MRRFPDRCLPAIVAVGSSLATLPAAALELGELTVESRLGQPLRASIAFALAPTENISENCISMRQGPSVSGLPGSGATRISVVNGVIVVTGDTPVREPMVSAHIVVNCPKSANLSREYMLFVDPATSADNPIYQDIVVTRYASVLADPVARDIATASQYQVRPGESLSEIVTRIQDRPIGLWTAVNTIFEANPNAFTNNDPNNLRAGSWLSIPSFNGNVAVVADVLVATENDSSIVESEADDGARLVYEPRIEAEVAEAPGPMAAAIRQPKESGISAAAIILNNLTNSNVAQAQPGKIILDTEVPAPTNSSQSPNVATLDVTASRAAVGDNGMPSLIAWLVGGGLMIASVLVAFRRRPSGKYVTVPAVPVGHPHHQRRFSDIQSTDTRIIETVQVDFEITDDSPTEENLALDADLILGTGHKGSADADLPFEPVADRTQEQAELSPSTTAEYAILESEIMPEYSNDDTVEMPVK